MSTENVKYTLFHVDSERDMKLEYPELATIEEFKVLSGRELRLCWLIGNTSSPIFKEPRLAKIKKALKTVFGEAHIESKAELKKFYEYKNGESDIPEKILKGITRMLHFNLENRVRARLFSQYTFDTMHSIVVDEDELKLMDMDDKKKYIELMIKINSELPKMIETLESGFGVKLIKEKDGSEVKININKLDM